MRQCALAVLLGLLWSGEAAAQVPPTPATDTNTTGVDTEPFAPLAKPSRFWPFWPSGALFEGEIFIPLPLMSRTERLRSVDPKQEAESYVGMGQTLVFLPHFVFRQSSDKTVPSAPVLTPTFNPGAEWSWFRLSTQRRGQSKRFWFPTIASTSRVGRLQAVQARFAHYSNGQAGCLYADQVKDADGNCPKVLVGGRLNELDGSFSTNYLEGEYSFNSLLFDGDLRERVRLGVSGLVRWNPPRLMDDELAEAYGRSSARLRLDFRSRHDRNFGLVRGWPPNMIPLTISAAVEAERAFHRAGQYPANRVSADVSVAFPYLYGFGLAARWARGADYYNIGFGRTIGKEGISSWSFGVIFDHSRAIALTERAKAATRRVFR